MTTSVQGGYTGRFLRVDLSQGTATVEESPDVRTWLGPRGWNALIGWNEVGPGVGPFDPQNRLVFSVGPLVGTGAPTAGRTTVSSLSPRGYPQPMWISASMGGYWGAELKYAGYDGLVVQGRAASPCYILIEDDRVSIEDAGELWGQGVYATQQALKGQHGDRLLQSAAIGPAGENRVRFASIIHRFSNAVGNGGLGGVMGAKQLKAVAVRGTRGPQIADPAGYIKTVREVWRLVRGGLVCAGQPEQGWPSVACTHGCSVRCWTEMRGIDGGRTPVNALMAKCNNQGFQVGPHPGYEGRSSTGQSLTVPQPKGFGEAGRALDHLLEDVGLTSWCYSNWGRYLGALREQGITELLGEPLAIDDLGWWRNWIDRVAHRRGTGDVYAEGVARFYETYRVGPDYLAEFCESAGSRGHGWHREGRTLEPHSSPFWEYSALLYAVSTRDVTPSTHGFLFLNGLQAHARVDEGPAAMPDNLRQFARAIYGVEDVFQPGNPHVPQITAWHQHRAIIKDSMGVCDWIYPVLRPTLDTREAWQERLETGHGSLLGDLGAEARLFRAATGIDIEIAEMERPIAERIVTLERCLDVRNTGRSRADDEAVIPHFQWAGKVDGTLLSADGHEFRAMLDDYYRLRGWDLETGHPTQATIAALGLPV